MRRLLVAVVLVAAAVLVTAALAGCDAIYGARVGFDGATCKADDECRGGRTCVNGVCGTPLTGEGEGEPGEGEGDAGEGEGDAGEGEGDAGEGEGDAGEGEGDAGEGEGDLPQVFGVDVLNDVSPFPDANPDPILVNENAVLDVDAAVVQVKSDPVGAVLVDLPNAVVVPQQGRDILLIHDGELNVATGVTLRIVGSRAVAFRTITATIDGTIDVSAAGATPGPGGFPGAARCNTDAVCSPSTCDLATAVCIVDSGPGSGETHGLFSTVDGGGGGASHGGPGARGVTSSTNDPGGAAGAVNGTLDLHVLVGGSGGGAGSTRGGGGGGAILVSAASSIAFGANGRILANGGAGEDSGDDSVGGGGAGGAIFLEAPTGSFGGGFELSVRGGTPGHPGGTSGTFDASGGNDDVSGVAEGRGGAGRVRFNTASLLAGTAQTFVAGHVKPGSGCASIVSYGVQALGAPPARDVVVQRLSASATVTAAFPNGGDRFGASVAFADDNGFFAGAPFADANNTDDGTMFFEGAPFDDGALGVVDRTYDVSAQTGPGGHAGTSIAAACDATTCTVAVGVPDVVVSGAAAGRVLIFHSNIATPEALTGNEVIEAFSADERHFGKVVAFDGTAAFLAVASDSAAGTDGLVDVYERDAVLQDYGQHPSSSSFDTGAGALVRGLAFGDQSLAVATVSRLVALDVESGPSGANAGIDPAPAASSVTVSGSSFMAAGVDDDSACGSKSGAVLVYQRPGVGTNWTLSNTYGAYEPRADARFGAAVASEAGRLVVGAPGSADALVLDSRAAAAGVELFPQATLAGSAAASGFGAAVDIGVSDVVVGAPGVGCVTNADCAADAVCVQSVCAGGGGGATCVNDAGCTGAATCIFGHCSAPPDGVCLVYNLP